MDAQLGRPERTGEQTLLLLLAKGRVQHVLREREVVRDPATHQPGFRQGGSRTA